VLLILAAVLLSGLLSSGIYIVVSQKMYANMRAQELKPIAQTIAGMLSEARRFGYANGYGVFALLDRENKSFLGASLHIYDEAGNPLLVSQPGTGPRENTDETAAIADAMIAEDVKRVLEGSEVSVARRDALSESYLVVGVPIRSDGDKGDVIGAVVFTKSMREINDTLGSLRITLLISMLIAFLIMLIPAYLLARRIVVPIRGMREAAHAMAGGDFSARAPETQKGELGELGRSMNYFAEESGKLEQTRRDYVANVSHELRMPIASIRAMGETLRDGMAKTDEKKELFYNNIVRESLRLSRLVDDLLELSRLQSGTEVMEKSSFDVREVMRNIADMYGHIAAQSGITLDITPPEGSEAALPVYSNPDRVEQVLVILMDNAIRHTPGGGRITLSSSPVTPPGAGGTLAVRVANTGEGISAEDLPHIFERFYKADKSHSGSGTGLGLSIAREIVRALGGTIRAESGDGVATFTFTV
jgi:signal transduction histidine kinase